MDTFGERHEARHSMERMYFLEGMLWNLIHAYEQDKHLESLTTIRKNIEVLSSLQSTAVHNDLFVRAPDDQCCDLDERWFALELPDALLL